MNEQHMSDRTGWTTVFCDSLEKVFPDVAPRPANSGIGLQTWRGGRVSFQIAFLPPETTSNVVLPHPPDGLLPRVVPHVSVPDGLLARSHAVDLVPARFLAFEGHDAGYVRDTPGLWPDLLRPLESGEAVAAHVGQWQGIWIELEIGDGAPLGAAEVAVELTTTDGTRVGEHSIGLDITDIPVRPLDIVNTHWLHCDCIAQYYQAAPFSEPFWSAVDRFMAAAAELGINSVLTPVWTPTLDTAVGTERLPVQLVDIFGDGETYSFDFSRLERWLALLRKNGLTHVELSHLFTQWGAEATPAIYVHRDGEQRREFGWDTPATDPRYRRLMEQLLPALKAFLDAEWGLDRVLFHISDEPTADMAPTYRAAKQVVEDLLEDCRVIDAMSAFSLYDEGLVREPVVATNNAAKFIEAGVSPMWLYYCVGQHRDVANRFFSMPSSRNRAFGTQLWATGAAGFLHWGFNFYNGYLSKRQIDPFTEPDAGGAFPAGDPFIVYPGPEGQPWHSIRGKVFAEAIEDLRLMKTLETMAGAKAVGRIVDPDGSVTLTHYSLDPDHYRSVRNRLIDAIREAA